MALHLLVYGAGFRTARATRTGIYAERCAKPHAEHEYCTKVDPGHVSVTADTHTPRNHMFTAAVAAINKALLRGTRSALNLLDLRYNNKRLL